MAGDMSNTSLSVSLPDSLARFVAQSVAEGCYSSASEYVLELIRRAASEQARAQLEEQLLKGFDSGDPIPVTAKFWDKLRERLAQHRAKRAEGA